jgi:hypothetical protein
MLAWQPCVKVGKTRTEDSVLNYPNLVVLLWFLSDILSVFAAFFALNKKCLCGLIVFGNLIVPKSLCSGVPNTTDRVLS